VIRSYTSTKLGPMQRLREFRQLYLYHGDNAAEQVRVLIQRMGRVEETVRALTGVSLRGLKILEIGTGQKLRQTRYLAMHNEVVGIDLDEIVTGFSPGGYWRMLRCNGPVRVLKTIGRKVLGIDRRFARELLRQLGGPPSAPPTLLQMDAARMRFPDASFDAVCSFSVFQAVPDPRSIVREVVRVLRPGGCAYLSTHLYTSDSGCNDPRIFSNNRAELPYWPHLRREFAARVRPNSYLNEFRMAAWDALFNAEMPGARFEHLQHNNDVLVPELARLRSAGELKDYTDDELLTVDYAVVWRKPGSRGAGP
jgi:SAM-dependent methyltransferase